MASQPTLTAQRAGAASAADTKSSAAGRGGTTLTADTDTPERAGDVGSGGTVERRPLASDQPRLTAGAQGRVAACP